jgi:Holliday junction DNA helicase RuvA
MIHHLSGKLVEKSPTHLVIECNGVGYFVHISIYTYGKIGSNENVKIYTHLIVREDAHILYGFINTEERDSFKNLISVSGIGPNTARMILSALNPADLNAAIYNEDVQLLKSVKGVGAKSAERIIVDLKGKTKKDENLLNFSSLQSNTTRDEALSALISLGFDKSVSSKVVDKVMANSDENQSVEQIIKESLRLM